jgi:ATP-dependent Clp protease ATP-binding subunit ClpC
MHFPTQSNLNIKICENCVGAGVVVETKKVCEICKGRGYAAYLGNFRFSFSIAEKKIYKVPILVSDTFNLWMKVLFFTFSFVGISSGALLGYHYLREALNDTNITYDGGKAFFELFFWLGILSLSVILYFRYEFPRPRKIINQELKKITDKELEDRKRKQDLSEITFQNILKLKRESLGQSLTTPVKSIVYNSIIKYGIGSPATFFMEILQTSKGKSALRKIGKEIRNVKNEIRKIIQEEKKMASSYALENHILPEGYLSLLLGIETSFLSGQRFLGIGAFILSSLKTPSGRKILDILEISEEDLENIVHWINIDYFNRRWFFWKQKTIGWTGGIALDWGYGYTINLDKYVLEMSRTRKRKGFNTHVLGRKNEIEELERILSRGSRRGNVLLIGDPGTGKGAIIRALAEKISIGNTLSTLRGKKIVSVDVGAMLGGAESIGAFEERFNKVLKEASQSGNVILFIGEVHEILDASSSGIDAGEFLRKGFEYGNQVIFSTTYEGFKKYIEPRSSLLEYLQVVRINELSVRDTIVIIEDYAENFEKYYKIKISYGAIKAAVELSDRYFKDRKLPAKAIDLLEDSVVEVAEKLKKTELTEEIVTNLVSKKTGIPISRMSESERDKLMNLENEFSKHIIGQKEATKAISDVLRRNRAGVSLNKKPIGSFLFIGPTGVGKTEVTKVLASMYFGSENEIIRLDMSEFQTKDSVKRLLGDYSQEKNLGGQLTEAIRKKPFSLILLDEIEKAYPDVLNIFLQVLDDGRLSDSTGRVFDLTHTIIIATSNVGAKYIMESTKQNLPYDQVKQAVINQAIELGKFSPEFLNRFDSIIYFKPLTEEEAFNVANLLLEKLKSKLAVKRIQLKISPEVVFELVKIGYNSEFGARSVRRVIQEKIESYVAMKIVSGEIKPGDDLEINDPSLISAN